MRHTLISIGLIILSSVNLFCAIRWRFVTFHGRMHAKDSIVIFFVGVCLSLFFLVIGLVGLFLSVYSPPMSE